MDRNASVLIADDMTISLVGKINLIGIYTADIIIPTDPLFIPQLLFLFFLETGRDDLFQRIQLQVTLPGQSTAPGQPTAVMDVPVPAVAPVPEGRIGYFLRQPFLLQHVLLRPGRIEAKVVHEKGEIYVQSLPWIVLPPTNPSVPVVSGAAAPDQASSHET
jgi:hypothetical protein